MMFQMRSKGIPGVLGVPGVFPGVLGGFKGVLGDLSLISPETLKQLERLLYIP